MPRSLFSRSMVLICMTVATPALAQSNEAREYPYLRLAAKCLVSTLSHSGTGR
ncbi:hypothetical protein EDC90_1006104 [Martelella mediterranea]|uniref:Uncharacterized protein n=1 Tax=Martelella mediterranea TaxID=293089 RepID=A0A4R3NWH9_9HYPH|nr:hypothetical protein EDC90_1006104 [Martelella mediterranea]